jgi:regulatory protein
LSWTRKNKGREAPSGNPLPAAFNLLARRAYTARELTDKLREKGFAAEETAATLAQLSEWRYIDDADYARRFCRTHRERRSQRWIYFDLLRRGAEEETIAAALEDEYPPEQETANCLRALRKKGAAEKAAGTLYRQGYRAENIRRALAEFAAEGQI